MANKKKRQKEVDVTHEFFNIPAFQIKDIKLTDKQRELVRLFEDGKCKVVFLSGPAGCTKSFCSVFSALLMLRRGIFEKIKYVRSLVESSQNKMGYLPGAGDLDGKLAPYAGPLYDKLEELLQSYDSKRLIDEKIIEVLTPNFLRGTTFKNSFVIVDEAQNMPFSDLVTTISRIGENSIIVFCYDPMQKDIKNSGIERMERVFNDQESIDNGIYNFQFTTDDIMRSPILKLIMRKLEAA